MRCGLSFGEFSLRILSGCSVSPSAQASGKHDDLRRQALSDSRSLLLATGGANSLLLVCLCGANLHRQALSDSRSLLLAMGGAISLLTVCLCGANLRRGSNLRRQALSNFRCLLQALAISDVRATQGMY